MMMSKVGVAVIGGGPAGISAAIAASVDGASVLLIDRETRLGGILKQCIHSDFGFLRYDEMLTGPEYAFRDISSLEQTNTFVLLQTTVTQILSIGNTFQLTLCNRHGIVHVEAKSIVLATGCIERSARQSGVHGSRPAGVMTAGNAQYYANIMGQLPARSSIFLGSGNIGLIMARRLTLEGGKVLGVYEPGQAPEGSLRNVVECLNDFDIPIHFMHTITHAAGSQRLTSVLISRVDKNLNPIRGSENQVKCDSLIISTGLIPETSLADSLGISIFTETGGPVCDQNNMTMFDGIFTCGNAMFINSLVDYISESGEIAGRNAARYMARERKLTNIKVSKDFLFCAPQYLDVDMLHNEATFFFRTRETRENVTVKVYADGVEVHSSNFLTIRKQEVERLAVSFNTVLTSDSKIELRLENS